MEVEAVDEGTVAQNPGGRGTEAVAVNSRSAFSPAEGESVADAAKSVPPCPQPPEGRSAGARRAPYCTCRCPAGHGAAARPRLPADRNGREDRPHHVPRRCATPWPRRMRKDGQSS